MCNNGNQPKNANFEDQGNTREPPQESPSYYPPTLLNHVQQRQLFSEVPWNANFEAQGTNHQGTTTGELIMLSTLLVDICATTTTFPVMPIPRSR